MICGLKIENNTVMMLEKDGNDWSIADISLIEDIETIIVRMEQALFPKDTKKEDIVFEKKHKIGAGRIRSYKDEDGDLTVEYQPEVIGANTVVNEDAAFWESASPGIVYSAAKEKGGAINNWGCTNEILKEGNGIESLTVNVADRLDGIRLVKRRKIQTPGGAAEDAKKRVAKKNIGPNARDVAINRYEKRKSTVSGLVNKLEKKKLILKMLATAYVPLAAKPNKQLPGVAYMAAGSIRKSHSLDSNLLISKIKFNRRKGIRSKPEEYFYLTPINTAEEKASPIVYSTPRVQLNSG